MPLRSIRLSVTKKTYKFRIAFGILILTMNLRNNTKVSHWLTAIIASVVIASVSLVAFNAYADESNGTNQTGDDHRFNMTNGQTQKEGYPYPHEYNMTYGSKDDQGWGDDKNKTGTSSTGASCGGGEAIINYTGTGSTSSTLVNHNLGAMPRVIYILDVTDSPASNVDGITTVVSTPQIVYVESGNDAYAPVSMPNHNIVNSTSIDVGQLYNLITGQASTSKAMNAAGTNYQMIAVNFGTSSCSSGTSSHYGGDDDNDQDHS